ncbi:hypothetical protein O7623_12955 [Solwaraspora sp. WMMD791]|uniref:hypothetical protein n=1 Tax=Solwaraspora sp. WMMD791 TaxID=3016086 RepID=UPI00249A3F79|nr:hypothetical protein [Solwaraspora sp. WMMD791]WFE30035.1 hypothetical protein O7623_12955 [Solwaraspora sp. WMMD791]
MAGASPAGPGSSGGHGITGLADAGAFLARLTRLDPAAVVRLRSVGPGRTELWARLPWSVLVQRTVAGPGPGDVTVAAGDLLTRLSGADDVLPPRRDDAWRWPVPSGTVRTVETVPADEVRRVAAAAAGTLRAAQREGVGGRAVGARALRDALLDHVAIVVTGDDAPTLRVEVRQSLVQAVVRMGFLGATVGPARHRQPVGSWHLVGRREPGPGPVSGGPTGGGTSVVRVRTVGNWVGLDAPYGVAWTQRVNILTLAPIANHPNG